MEVSPEFNSAEEICSRAQDFAKQACADVRGLGAEEIYLRAQEFAKREYTTLREKESYFCAATSLFQVAASSEHIKAHVRLGECYEKGMGSVVKRNVEEAVELYRVASAASDPDGLFRLGLCYKRGTGVEESIQEALKLWRKAGETGHADSNFRIGLCFGSGLGVDQDHDKSVHYYQLASEAGHAVASHNLGVCYANGEGVAKNQRKAVELYTKAVNCGDMISHITLGRCYEQGNGVEVDLKKACDLFLVPALRGHLGAQCDYAFAVQGLHYVEALQEGVLAGEIASQFSLAMVYYDGKLLPRNIARTIDLLEKASDRGHPIASLNLGNMYQDGIEIQQDPTIAASFFEKAASQGFKPANSSLGLLYFYGRGVPQNFRKGLDLVKKGEDLDGFVAMAYMCGLGGNHDDDMLKQAEASLRRCVDKGENEADGAKFLLASLLASSTFEGSLSEARSLLEGIQEGSASYQRAQWLLPFIDDQDIQGIRSDWDLQPKPDFISDAEIQIIAKIGEGHFATVYLALLRKTEWVAVKYLSVDLVQDDVEIVRNVMRERFTCRLLSSHKACGVIGYRGFVDDLRNGKRGLVFELWADTTSVAKDLERHRKGDFVAAPFCDLETIDMQRDWSTRVVTSMRQVVVFAARRPSTTVVIGMLRDAAIAIQNVHRMGFIHRDIASRNILCDQDFNVRLADFGLAKFVGSPMEETSKMARYRRYHKNDHQYAIAWWAPECIGSESESAIFSIESDIYSFGCVMWQCFAGRDPFDDIVATGDVDKDTSLIADTILSGERPNPGKLSHDTPDGLIRLMKDCWETDPEDRPTLTSILNRLEEINSLKPPTGRPPDIRSAERVKKRWFDLKSVYHTIDFTTISKKRNRHEYQGSFVYQKWGHQIRDVVHHSPPSLLLSKTLADRFRYHPQDVFCIHTGAQKIEQVATLEDILRQGGFRCFFDREMQNGDGAPTEQMSSSLETCRHCVVVISKAFLKRKDPCSELCYAFEKMEWIREHYPGWESLWIVLYDLSVPQYSRLRTTATATALPNIGSRVTIMEWKGGQGDYPTWPTLCHHLKAQIIEHDNKDAVRQWKAFLDEKSSWEHKSFPSSRQLYSK